MKPNDLREIKTRVSFAELRALRKAWRAFHEVQDKENADRTFCESGVDKIRDTDLKFFPEVFRLKLNEFGRDWERALAAQGICEGNNFYRLQLEISVNDVSELHRWIETSLDPIGSSLFFESNGLHGIDGGTWHALFYFTLEPGRQITEIDFGVAPGILSKYPALRIA